MEDKASIIRIGRIGFWLALAPWLAYVLTFVFAVAGMPGFG
jgi:hypothetical protein